MQCHAGNTPLRWRCRYSAASNSSIALNVSVSAASLSAPLAYLTNRRLRRILWASCLSPLHSLCCRGGVAIRYVCFWIEAGADLGFYKSGCPIHLKGAPEVERPPSQLFWPVLPEPNNFFGLGRNSWRQAVVRHLELCQILHPVLSQWTLLIIFIFSWFFAVLRFCSVVHLLALVSRGEMNVYIIGFFKPLDAAEYSFFSTVHVLIKTTNSRYCP